MPLVPIPDHKFFQNGDDGYRRDAEVVAELCTKLGLTPDEAIDLLAAVGRVELAHRNTDANGDSCRKLLGLSRTLIFPSEDRVIGDSLPLRKRP